mmetsp:Transcript_6512/g.15045  ORF Transcript_6512/g.15045 Transcript_6512/m.15045 type:complete len:469 (+) Transcript_6512:44-1450(+)|eukprot:CAMPEP_0114559132 /NCGR_PEP_ID=MMETSP0114-20121206/10760_1 /TAXON_ID=31324 /ORGANISM="Goniomonas sp, Strain m" /LENGTH=468 /DNA_ID=CAMNT_0001744585 /DNA_START=15 /DNA_END=1421 /DNA_ORIENTATION=+
MAVSATAKKKADPMMWSDFTSPGGRDRALVSCYGKSIRPKPKKSQLVPKGSKAQLTDLNMALVEHRWTAAQKLADRVVRSRDPVTSKAAVDAILNAAQTARNNANESLDGVRSPDDTARSTGLNRFHTALTSSDYNQALDMSREIIDSDDTRRAGIKMVLANAQSVRTRSSEFVKELQRPKSASPRVQVDSFSVYQVKRVATARPPPESYRPPPEAYRPAPSPQAAQSQRASPPRGPKSARRVATARAPGAGMWQTTSKQRETDRMRREREDENIGLWSVECVEEEEEEESQPIQAKRTGRGRPPVRMTHAATVSAATRSADCPPSPQRLGGTAPRDAFLNIVPMGDTGAATVVGLRQQHAKNSPPPRPKSAGSHRTSAASPSPAPLTPTGKHPKQNIRDLPPEALLAMCSATPDDLASSTPPESPRELLEKKKRYPSAFGRQMTSGRPNSPCFTFGSTPRFSAVFHG